VMAFRWAILIFLVLNLANVAATQRSQNRIDLSVDEATLPEGVASPPAISGIAFRPADVTCPEEHGTIEIRSGQMYLHRTSPENQVRPNTEPGRGLASLSHAKPLDDETYQYQIGNGECRVTLHVRLQLRGDDGWQPALLPYFSRPSVSDEERSVHARELRRFFEERPASGKSEPRSRPPPSPQILGASGISEAFFFEGPSQARLSDCFQAVGSYDLGQQGVFFTFLRALPGNVNRFAIERNDINSYQGRLFFVHGDCRFQVTTSGLRKYNSDWAPLAIDDPI
jgi:hypothetical protein